MTREFQTALDAYDLLSTGNAPSSPFDPPPDRQPRVWDSNAMVEAVNGPRKVPENRTE